MRSETPATKCFAQATKHVLMLGVVTACTARQTPFPTVTFTPPTAIASPSAIPAPTTLVPATPTQALLSAVPAPTLTPTPYLAVDPVSGWKVFTDASFGLSFQFPPTWHGPETYAWAQGLRVEVGSDMVYPAGTDLQARRYNFPNSYSVAIQYTANTQNWELTEYVDNQPWLTNYLALLEISDGESRSGIRDLFIRVRAVGIGRYEGLEYIVTLSDTAQTEYFYVRRIDLFDEHLNLLTIAGSPTNVEVLDRANWREAYRLVDEAHLDVFHKIVQFTSIE